MQRAHRSAVSGQAPALGIHHWIDDVVPGAPPTTLTALSGTSIVIEGAPATHVYLVRSGTVELRRSHGGRHSVIAWVGQGGVIGDVSALLRRTHHADAIALGPVELYCLEADTLTEQLHQHPECARRWMTSLAMRLFETHQRVDEILVGHLDLRIAAVLLRRADASGRVDLTQQQLASLVGVQRSSVTEAVRRLAIRGFLRRGYGHVVITDRSRLHDLVNGA